MKNVRITVLRKMFNADFAREYLKDDDVGECDYLNEGDVFLYEGGAQIPEGFCPWAWQDIYSGVKALAQGATFSSWINRDGAHVYCCTDGIRPVVFLMEAIDR